jgi:hypothetical protein
MSHYTYWLSDILEINEAVIYLKDAFEKTKATATTATTATTNTKDADKITIDKTSVKKEVQDKFCHEHDKEIRSKNKVSALYNKENNVENKNGYEFLS